MFERFTTDARNAVVEAQIVARQAGSPTIDTRHVLIALAEPDGAARDALEDVGVGATELTRRLRADIAAGGLDGQALASLGIDLDAVRRQADAVFGAGALERAARRSRAGHLPFAAEAKKTLELALREAVRLHASAIDGNFLLLGVLRCSGCAAESELRRALAEAGSDPASLRAAIERRVSAARSA